jgi:hypothetical protein
MSFYIFSHSNYREILKRPTKQTENFASSYPTFPQKIDYYTNQFFIKSKIKPFLQ